MTDGWLIGAVAAVIVSGALAIAGIERGIPLLTRIFKPLATILLLVVVGRPHSSFAWLVIAGIVLSLVGDVALLSDSDRAFMVGLVGFLAAHVLYIIANLSVAVWSPIPIVVGVVILASTMILLRYVRPSALPLRIATIVYGTAISTMVVSAWATIGSHLAWAPFAAVGALLFYISDSSLALDRFYKKIPHVAYLALGVYWLGQIGIAIAARGPVR
jgi:uncharacterized membrane protein YhhN